MNRAQMLEWAAIAAGHVPNSVAIKMAQDSLSEAVQALGRYDHAEALAAIESAQAWLHLAET